MKHTYLFEEATWRATGTYIDEKGRCFSLEGISVITHTKNKWINSGSMRVFSDPELILKNEYTIEPFEACAEATSWVSRNPALGRMKGNFIIVADTIFSVYTAGDIFSGIEMLKQVNESTYQNRGALMEGSRKVSSWSVELDRQE
jgi:hypothetical protein